MISRIKEIKNLIQNYLDFSLSSRSFQTRNYSVNEKKKEKKKMVAVLLYRKRCKKVSREFGLSRMQMVSSK